MQFPLLIARRNTLIVAAADFFEGIGLLDEKARQLEINVAADGQAWLQWILEANGTLHPLQSTGLHRASMLQRLGLQRRREVYRMSPPEHPTVGQLLLLIDGRQDERPEAPNVSDLQRHLQQWPSTELIRSAHLADYFG